MRLQRLELEKMGCFDRAAFDFADVTVVFGENRTGKSTLVYALFFALFGRHLNSGLGLKDLCTKGESSGAARLVFEKEASVLRIRRSTDRLPELHEISDGGRDWRSVNLADPEDLGSFIPLSPETAALTVFFRESELIYFLQDIPKYNKTLLQSLIGIDDILIIQSRFKKALAKAREFKKGVDNAPSSGKPDPLDIELARRGLAKAEDSLRHLESEYRRTVGPTPETASVYKLLQQQYEETQKQREQANRRKEDFAPVADLESKKASLRARAASADTLRRSIETLQNRIGSKTEEMNQIRSRMERLTGLELNSICPLCEQELPAERLAVILAEMEQRSAAVDHDRRSMETELEKQRRMEMELESVTRAIQEIDDRIREARELDRRITEMDIRLKELKANLSSFHVHENTLAEGSPAEVSAHDRERELGETRRKVQEAIIHNRVLLRQYEDRTRQFEEKQKNLDMADRNILICGVAHQAMEEAVRMLGSRMLDRVRQSIRTWSGHFTFLHRFDIQMTDRELLPIIQAKGYHYKLNQMSKSERIFLYIMLKLAIGEALGHLGLFILDDPADGLDDKRKQTLAHLLSEVAKQRQVIVTTNDPVFAGFFPDSRRIDL